jgi:C4-dicarboxylate transporter DctM subunit
MLIILFLLLFFGLLAVGMPIFLVLGLCALSSTLRPASH